MPLSCPNSPNNLIPQREAHSQHPVAIMSLQKVPLLILRMCWVVFRGASFVVAKKFSLMYTGFAEGKGVVH